MDQTGIDSNAAILQKLNTLCKAMECLEQPDKKDDVINAQALQIEKLEGRLADMEEKFAQNLAAVEKMRIAMEVSNARADPMDGLQGKIEQLVSLVTDTMQSEKCYVDAADLDDRDQILEQILQTISSLQSGQNQQSVHSLDTEKKINSLAAEAEKIVDAVSEIQEKVDEYDELIIKVGSIEDKIKDAEQIQELSLKVDGLSNLAQKAAQVDGLTKKIDFLTQLQLSRPQELDPLNQQVNWCSREIAELKGHQGAIKQLMLSLPQGAPTFFSMPLTCPASSAIWPKHAKRRQYKTAKFAIHPTFFINRRSMIILRQLRSQSWPTISTNRAMTFAPHIPSVSAMQLVQVY